MSSPAYQPHAGEVRVYIAARTEDQARAAAVRDSLRHYGIGCTSRWLDLLEVPRVSTAGARVCVEDIQRADVVILLNPREAHRTGTGGRHTELGIAIGCGKPALVLGDAENVFHSPDHHVQIVPGNMPPHALAAIVKLAALHGTPLPVDCGAAAPPA